MREFKYRRVHIPTGRVWDCQLGPEHPSYKDVLIDLQFMDLLVRWNEQQPETWVYAPI